MQQNTTNKEIRAKIIKNARKLSDFVESELLRVKNLAFVHNTPTWREWELTHTIGLGGKILFPLIFLRFPFKFQ